MLLPDLPNSNPDHLKKRQDAVFASEGERLQGVPRAQPVDVMNDLRIYLKNCWTRRSIIKHNNKRFMTRFGLNGTPCKPDHWNPPQPIEEHHEGPYQTEFGVFLDDVEQELALLILQRPPEEVRSITVDFQLSSAVHEMARTLGCQNCQIRNSETLVTLLVTEKSEGNHDTLELQDAYHFLNFDPAYPPGDENFIIGNFRSRLESSAPSQESDLRRSLLIIGRQMNSQKIIAVAEDDNPNDTEKAIKAVKIIADTRKSQKLWTWLETGDLGDSAMDAAEAYARLHIDDRTIPDELVSDAYQICILDTPDAEGILRKALLVISEERKSGRLLQMANISQNIEAPVSPDWPVGLQNIGNTCYLNSLLQFFFTVSPLRDLVLHFDQFKMDITEETVGKKRVSARKVDAKEIQRSQSFVTELGKLFQNMISSPESSVKPDLQLARLALVASRREDAIRRESLVKSDRPNLGTLNGVPISGPVGPPAENLESQSSNHQPLKTVAADAEARKNNGKIGPTNSSEETLVSLGSDTQNGDVVMNDVAKTQQPAMLLDKENLPPQKVNGLVNNDNSAQPLTDASDLSASKWAQASSSSNNAQEIGKETPEDTAGRNAPSSRPPPVPPRPKASRTQETVTLEEVEYGAQQDVSEVIENVLFQLSSAIKPLSTDSDGEQSDQIKKMFWGRLKSTLVSRNGEQRDTDSIFYDVRVNVASGPQDIYCALDGAFDVQSVQVGSSTAQQYSSIKQAPPILQVCIQRAQWDREKKENVKSNNHLSLKETIYLDRYLEGNAESDILYRRKEAWLWKQELAELISRRQQLATTEAGCDTPSVFAIAQEILQGFRDSDIGKGDETDLTANSLATLASLGEQARYEMSEVDSRIRDLQTSIDSQFSDLREHPYRLHALFMHRGSGKAGHFWIYIRDFERDIWRAYNDTYVTEVPQLDIFQAPTDDINPPNPYIVVYVQDPNLVKSVCRDIIVPSPKVEDVEMADVPVEVTDNDGEGPSFPSMSELPIRWKSQDIVGNWDYSEANVNAHW
ncbi:MAG: hypothetical protein Q9227_006823 [Pyrenula ochraceoflavens]